MTNFEYPNSFEMRCAGMDAKTNEYVIRYYEIFSTSSESLAASKKSILGSFKKSYNSPNAISTIKVLNKG